VLSMYVRGVTVSRCLSEQPATRTGSGSGSGKNQLTLARMPRREHWGQTRKMKYCRCTSVQRQTIVYSAFLTPSIGKARGVACGTNA